MTQQDVPRWEPHVLCAPGAVGIAAPAPEEEYSGGSAGGSCSSDTTRLESASSIGEEDSDSGSWWSYPSECGSVVELNRAVAGLTSGFAGNKHHDHSELPPSNCSPTTLSNYFSTSSAIPVDAVVATAVIYSDASRKGPGGNPHGGAVILPPSPDRPVKSRCVNGRSRSVSDDNAQDYDVNNHGSAEHGANTEYQPFEPPAHRASFPGGEGSPTADHCNNQVNTGSHALPKPAGKVVNSGRAAAIRKSALATEARHSAPSIVRHVTFKDLSASSGSDDDDYSSGQGRNRNSASYHGDDQQNVEADLDDSGYLDGDSTSSSSDISPPSSLSWESAIDSSSSRKSHGRSADQQCFVDSGGGGDRNGTHSPPGPRCESRAGVAEERRTKSMNGMHRDSDDNSTLSFVQTEICVSQSVRREDSYEYYRNGTRIAKLNNVNQTSWSETSSTETTERCTPLGKRTDVEKTVFREQTTPQPKPRCSQADDAAKTSTPPQPTRRVLPSVDGARKRQPEVGTQRRQSATRESGKQKKESAGGGGVRNVGGSVKAAVVSSAANDACQQREYHRWRQQKTPQHPVAAYDDEGTSCDLEDDEEEDSAESQLFEEEDVSFHLESPPAARHHKQRAGTVSATATSRAVARSRGGSTTEPSRASALASVRAQSRDPFLALAVATAKAATTASAEASREIYAGCKQFAPPPDLDVVVRTACSVGGSEDAVDRARHARSQPADDIVSVSSSPVYKASSSSARSDVRLPTPLRYKEFSSLHLKKSGGSREHVNGHYKEGDVSPFLEREPLPCEQRSFHVHSDVLPTRADTSPPTSSTPSPVLLEDRVRVLQTPVKSNAVIVDNIPDSDDCDGPPITCTPKVSNGHCSNKRPATLPVNGGTGPVCHRKPPPVPQQQKQQQQASQPLLLRPPKPVPPPRSRSPLDPAEHLERITGYATARRLAQTLPKPQVQLPEPHMSPATGRLVSSRRRFFENLQRQQEQQKRPNDASAAPGTTAEESAERLLGFRASAQAARESLAKSSPDLAALEADAWRSRRLHDRWPPPSTEPQHAPRQQQATGTEPIGTAAVLPPRSPAPAVHPDKFNRLVEQTRSRYARRRCGQPAHDERRRSRSLGYLETDVDTLCCRQVKASISAAEGAEEDTAQNSDEADDAYLNRTRSMDRFLEDGTVGCPLLGDEQRTKSEHELRIERSLQKLELPEWYTRRGKPAETGILRARRDSVSSTGRSGWQGLGSRTPSTASLAANTPDSRNLVIPKRVTAPDWRCWHASRESLTSSPGSHDGGGSLSRWGSVSSAPAAAWSYRSMRQPYLGWRAAPSTGTTTPLSSAGSRPVSPGGGWTTPSAFDYNQQQQQQHHQQQHYQQQLQEQQEHRQQQQQQQQQSASPCIPRDRYSYVQGIYGDGGGWNVEREDDSEAVCPSVISDIGVPSTSASSNGAARPAVWMESSFVGSKPVSTSSVVAAQSPAAPALAGEPGTGKGEMATSLEKTTKAATQGHAEKRPSCQGDVTLEDVLSSLLALADSSPSQSRLGTPSKPPASPVSPDIRHVSFALSPSKGAGGLLPDAGHPYGRRCSEGMARPATPISILKPENNRWMGSATATAEAAPLAHQTAWASAGDVKITVPLSSGSSSLDRSPDPAAKEAKLTRLSDFALHMLKSPFR
ncbi:uncharacterized protein LOC142583106 isoform X2 [Dermacentor variabilis]|uniref:uncharacterized protein LOC142583106 isoform X2 n=1 Tax=Dermacentor variabilis TaxID=34621 RepID=UPI003F5B0C90